jgi:hypothetical protein
MTPSSPLLTLSDTILWLKVILSVAALILVYLRYRKLKAAGASSTAYSARAKGLIVLGVVFSFAVFHNLGTFRAGSFVHHAEMFHYYLGAKYFNELGYYDLYNAVVAADSEQGNQLAGLPFLTDLRTYQNTQRDIVLADTGRVKNLFSKTRWNEFKDDVSFFKKATTMPGSSGISTFLMDHGYNASPVSTSILKPLTNLVPVTQLRLLAALDVLLVVTIILLVFRTFGFDIGALFSVYFFVNILNDNAYISGSLLRYDWLLYIVIAVCLLERGRYASSSFFMTLSAMMRIFPAVLFVGIAVSIFQQLKTSRVIDRKYMRFVLTATVTGLVLFLLPAVSLGSALQPWSDFYRKTELHDRGVYVNHLGLRGIVLFEPSHLSLDRFIDAYKSAYTSDIVRRWQDVKENEFRQKRPVVLFCSVFVLICLVAIIWNRRENEIERVLWPLLLVYTASYPSHYYYVFLSLFVLLFFRRPDPLRALVPVCLLFVLNIGALVTDYFRPSPIVSSSACPRFSLSSYMRKCLGNAR